MIIWKRNPEEGIRFAFLPTITPDGWVWLEFVKWKNIDGFTHCYRLISQARYDLGERVEAGTHKSYCTPDRCHCGPQ